MIPKNDELIEYLIPETASGTIHYRDRRMLVFGADALGLLRKNLIETLGVVEGSMILWKFGYAMGYRDAVNLKESEKPSDPEAWLRAGLHQWALLGWAAVHIKSIKIDKKDCTFEMESEWLNSYEAEQHRLHFGKSEDSVCVTLTGYIYGYASAVMECDVFFVEKKCRARGDDRCLVTGSAEFDKDSEEARLVRGVMEKHEIDYDALSRSVSESTGNIRRLIHELKAQEEKVKTLETQLFYLQETSTDASELLGANPAFKRALKNARTVAASDSTVLITGETGTGKELFARYIHAHSPRAGRPLVTVNCAALPAGLVESELFGHEKGAFTGAVQRKPGKFEIANHSTIFLDEIGELPTETQTKFLRVLQEGEFERVGGTQVLRTDARVIAATNQNLERLVEEGKFRADLFYRLNVFPIGVPPLRDRGGDIVRLVNFFVQKYNRKFRKRITSISGESLESLKNYDFPGNVRELQHLVERAVLLSEGEVLSIDVPGGGASAAASVGEFAAASSAAPSTLEQMERRYIEEILRRTNGVIAGRGGAAEILDLPPSTLRSRMKKLGIK
ncbi:MAG TPA: sigma 54-interacting transcriptional regulator [Pyrinomonadaceae bacterium]|jgi:transcriptional regulator with PAS, ATPase and Fis domain